MVGLGTFDEPSSKTPAQFASSGIEMSALIE